MELVGRTYSSPKYRYGFNGKEKDDEVKGSGAQYDYGMRIYDPRIGRFLSLDPITLQYPELTPYQFASNTPIYAIDLDGLEMMGNPYATLQAMKINEAAVALEKTDNKQEAEKIRRNAVIVNLIAQATLADVMLTRGKLSSTLLSAQVLGAFEHNRAKTPEGKAAQDQRRNDALFSAGFIWATSKIIGSTISFLSPIKEEYKYLFRGTSKGFEGNSALQKTYMTPTSPDPAVATIFAIESKNYGEGVLHIALPSKFQGAEYTVNVLATLEREVVVGVTPVVFAKKASITITAEQSRGILAKMGINIPARVSLSDISSVIKNTPKMTQKQSDQFYGEAAKIKKP